MLLTEEQKRIVEHGKGPALVFAVAGAGKTTAMVHRIARLVNSENIDPQKILAATYSKEGALDIERECRKLNIPGKVSVRTLHALSLSLLKRAQFMNIINKKWQVSVEDDAVLSLMNKALVRIAKERNLYKSDLNIDIDELLQRVSWWKANLFYPDKDEKNMTPAMLEEIRIAEDDDNPLFVKAYRYYEEERKNQFLVTFDDMLVYAWECLMKSEILHSRLQDAFDYVLIDEFQDINLVQYKILDLITRKKKNFMVIGDDDQCIYEWRGASSRFILNFEKKYKAKVYSMSDNFRCKAPVLLSANNLISSNKVRHQKQMHLTKGLSGNVYCKSAAGQHQMSMMVYNDIQELINRGVSPAQIVILIREYAQTPFIETLFIEKNFPYRIAGYPPFYRRGDASVLFNYLRWLRFENEIALGKYPDTEETTAAYLQCFREIINKPNRYAAATLVDQICSASAAGKRSAAAVIQENLHQVKKGTAENLIDLIYLYNNLVKMISQPARYLLKKIADETGFRDYIIDRYPVPELGELKSRIVDAVIGFAEGRGNVKEFLSYVDELIEKDNLKDKNDEEAVRVMTVYKAKGLEWDYVFIPDCNEGTIPLLSSSQIPLVDEKEYEKKLEEERRLFYVGMTRSKENLYLYYDRGRFLSKFIPECMIEKTMRSVEDLKSFLERVETAGLEEMFSFVKEVSGWGLINYFVKYHQFDGRGREVMNSKLHELGKKISEAVRKSEEYDKEIEKYNEEMDEYRKGPRDRHGGRKIKILLNEEFRGTDLGNVKFFFEADASNKIFATDGSRIMGIIPGDEYKKINHVKSLDGRNADLVSVADKGAAAIVRVNPFLLRSDTEKRIPVKPPPPEDSRFADKEILEKLREWVKGRSG